MKKYIILLTLTVIAAMNTAQTAAANAKVERYRQAVAEYDKSQAAMAKDNIVMALAYSKSPMLKEHRRGGMPGSYGLAVIDLAMQGLGVNRSPAANEALLDLLVTTADAGASEALDCAIVIKGAEIVPQLENFNAAERLENCRSAFSDLKKTVLRNVTDVTVEDICQFNTAGVKKIANRVDDLIQAIKAKTVCE
ncbi:Imm57 family immunity protein [Intestinirhabdus alba]|jgi:hypothetical protein|uniref:Uncharacterized protein n=1 Tax=Intestinirhabdus alba TaxID=2899544 RepID=A0A6L6ITK4_9ENTR|nr:Imm57 family immunity protein [Intestinirhabdus alba]MTH48063.1 hypothetical protein [Intestinirhabdus alba]